MAEFLTVSNNLCTAMRFFGEASGSGEIHAFDGSVAMFSGLDYGVFNIGLLTHPASQAELETQLQEHGKFFGERTLRWSFWLCADLLDAAARRRERQTFAALGMRPISNPPGMLAPALLPATRPLPKIECRPVKDPATRAAFTEITSVAFDIPYTVAYTVYSREESWHGDYHGYVGFVDGKAVGIAAMVAAGGAIGVYSLATLPSFRRQGYGEALLRAAAAMARERTGIDQMVLQSTEAGYDLYRRMGFHDVTKFTVYLTK